MSTESPSPPQAAPAPAETKPKPRRLRRFLFASVLLVTGGVIGAVVAGPVAGQGWHGDRMFFPGPIERGVERLGWMVDASTEQKQKINAIAQKAADDVFELRTKHLEARKQAIAILAAPTIDRAQLESLRTDQMKLAETAARRITDSVGDIAEVLTPAQRADLAQRLERWHRWRRG
jgi:Spy/CpxP family protein refolding chaperone